LTFALSRAHNRFTVRRFAPIVLLITFLALGTGLLESLHLRTHMRDHARDNSSLPDQDRHDRSDGDCAICIQLHLPALSAAWVPFLVCLGLMVAFLSLLSSPPARRQIFLRLDCRGPPVL
jgi:hypothetical protein